MNKRKMLIKDSALNERDLIMLIELVDQKIDNLDRAIYDYKELDDDVPEWMLDDELGYYELKNKLNAALRLIKR